MSHRTEYAQNRSLQAWGAELRAMRWLRQQRRATIAMMLVGVTAIAIPVLLNPAPRLVWNASASAPIGLYAVAPGVRLRIGDKVIAWAPPPARRLAAERHYLPSDVPLVKRIMAGPGDRICARGATILINDRPIAERVYADRAGRPLPLWFGCRRLHAEQFLLLNRSVPASFDGRYFGPTNAHDIIGKADLLWAR